MNFLTETTQDQLNFIQMQCQVSGYDKEVFSMTQRVLNILCSLKSHSINLLSCHNIHGFENNIIRKLSRMNMSDMIVYESQFECCSSCENHIYYSK